MAFLVGPGRRLALPAAAQHLSADGRFHYRGGGLPLAPELAERASRLAARAVDAVEGLRGYVGVVSFVITWLLVLTAGLLACFSIPTDLRQQTMHTVVTKPVERYEIVLGRFLGFTMLMTLVLVVMTALSLVYVARGVVPEAKEESFKARIPVFGDLHVQSIRDGRISDSHAAAGDSKPSSCARIAASASGPSS